jgi:hypothetical protein
MIRFRRHSGIALGAAVPSSFLNMAVAVAVEFSPIAQAQVENESWEGHDKREVWLARKLSTHHCSKYKDM